MPHNYCTCCTQLALFNPTQPFLQRRVESHHYQVENWWVVGWLYFKFRFPCVVYNIVKSGKEFLTIWYVSLQTFLWQDPHRTARFVLTLLTSRGCCWDSKQRLLKLSGCTKVLWIPFCKTSLNRWRPIHVLHLQTH